MRLSDSSTRRAAARRALTLAVALALLPVLGLPITTAWKLLALVAASIVLACSELRVSRGRLAAAAAAGAAAILLRALLPQPAVEEGHNIFLVTEDDAVLRNGIPAPVYAEWRRMFEVRYPPDAERDAIWRQTPPLTLYASSSDALWQSAPYSRTVETIDFENLAEFRGGFANDPRYSFYGGDQVSLARGFRADLPFFVMYEFTDAAVGSTLHWRGTAYWEDDRGGYERLPDDGTAGRAVRPEDAGRRVYALHLPAPLSERPWENVRDAAAHAGALSMTMTLSPAMAAARAFREIAGALALVVIVVLLARPHWRKLATAAVLVTAGLVITVTVIHFSAGKYLGATYPPHGAGDDGLSHEAMGRAMAAALMRGDWSDALRGGQDVYWDTPGMRYVRMVEKVVFGDTNLGYLALVVLLPWFVFALLRVITPGGWAWAGAGFFLLSPLGTLSYVQYIQNAKLGYAETASFTFFVLGAVLLMRSLPAWGGRPNRSASAFFGSACLAGAMFLRPNLAIAVALLGTVHVFAGWRAREFSTAMATVLGLACALWMPLHNYLYGQQLVLISSSTSIVVGLTPGSYADALRELVAGKTEGTNLALVRTQLAEWLFAEPRLPTERLSVLMPAMLLLRLTTLAVTVVAAAAWLRRRPGIALLAAVALAAHAPLLFIIGATQFRYAMPAWDLCGIVTLGVIADVASRFRRSRSSTVQAV